MLGKVRSVLLGPVLALGLAVPAHADVDVTAAPTITGSAVVGAKLTANGGGWTGPSGTTVGRSWLQCPTASATDWACSWLDNTNATTFTVRPADKDKWIRVALWAYKDWDWDFRASNATAKIAAAAVPTPTPTPPRATPTPTPPRATPTPVATSAPVSTPPAVATPTPEPEPVATPEPPAAAPPAPVTLSGPVLVAPKAKPKLMRPFPRVRISGNLTPRGANVTRLSVKAPKGVRISATCAGSGCPVRSGRLHAFERELRAGTRLTITVAKAGHYAKVTTITIRRGKSPSRRDRCRAPGASRLVPCPNR